MLEFDMNDAAFLAPSAHGLEMDKAEAVWSPTMELFTELRLLSVAESEAERA